jgi:uracil-DNA glycosylase
MSAKQLAKCLIETLPKTSAVLFNPYLDNSADDARHNSPDARLERLSEHLDCDASLVLIGEAPGYQGCRVTGVAFTSERLLMDGKIPRVRIPLVRLSSRPRPWSELSATIVWNELNQLKVAESTVLWNALQMHPHQEGNPLSNRTPSRHELRAGSKALSLLREAYPQAKFIAVGRKAAASLQASDIEIAGAIRHPAFGGKAEFVQGLKAVVTGRDVDCTLREPRK